MRILQINNYHYPRGGSDRYFLNVSRALADRGHEVQTFAPEDPRDTEIDLKAVHKPTGIDLNSKPSLSKAKNFFFNSKNRAILETLLAKLRPDVAHLHIYYGRVTPSILEPLKRFGVPIVQTLHEYKIVCPAQSLLRNGEDCYECQKQRYWNCILGRCNRNSITRSTLSTLETYVSNYLGDKALIDRFLAVSNFQRDKLINMGMAPETISVLHNFSEITSPPSDHRGKYFLFVGRIVEGKGLDTLLHSYARYRSKCIDQDPLPLHVVGDGPLRAKYCALSSTLRLKPFVKWRGSLYGDALDLEYRECRALINPSKFNETFGLTNLEAMSHGRAVLCSDQGAFPEIVRHGVDGYVLPARDPIIFAEYMAKLDVRLAMEFGRSGHARAKSKFSKTSHLNNLTELYTCLARDK